jgi:hypothetical protein
MINCLIKHMKPSSTNKQQLSQVVDVINSLSIKECFTYRNSTWNLISDWFKKIINFNNNNENDLVKNYLNEEMANFLNDSNTDDFTTNNISVKLAKVILLLLDTNEEQIFKSSIETLSDKLVSCNKYIYMSTERIEKCLLILNSMIDFLKSILKFNLELELK